MRQVILKIEKGTTLLDFLKENCGISSTNEKGKIEYFLSEKTTFTEKNGDLFIDAYIEDVEDQKSILQEAEETVNGDRIFYSKDGTSLRVVDISEHGQVEFVAKSKYASCLGMTTHIIQSKEEMSDLINHLTEIKNKFK